MTHEFVVAVSPRAPLSLLSSPLSFLSPRAKKKNRARKTKKNGGVRPPSVPVLYVSELIRGILRNSFDSYLTQTVRPFRYHVRAYLEEGKGFFILSSWIRIRLFGPRSLGDVAKNHGDTNIHRRRAWIRLAAKHLTIQPFSLFRQNDDVDTRKRTTCTLN